MLRAHLKLIIVCLQRHPHLLHALPFCVAFSAIREPPGEQPLQGDQGSIFELSFDSCMMWREEDAHA